MHSQMPGMAFHQDNVGQYVAVKSPILLQSVAGASTPCDAVWRQINMVELFPQMFTFVSLLSVSAPLLKTFSFAYDPGVVRWIGVGPMVATALSLLLVAVGAEIHRRLGRPHKMAVVISLVGSSLVLVLVGNQALMNAYEYGDKFAASDCHSFTEKYEIERSWRSARDFYTDCQSLTWSGPYLISDCPDYGSRLVENPDWRYLHELEKAYSCGGWCTPQPPLWTSQGKKAARDACGTVIGEVLETKVKYLSKQLVAYGLVVLAASVVFLILAGPSIREQGIRW